MFKVFLDKLQLNKVNFLQDEMVIIFVDIEGEPAQELSAISMNINTRQITDVYHAYAYTDQPDEWSRCHIHGLNQTFLKENGFSDESTLVSDFKRWIQSKDVLATFANNPMKEIEILKLPVQDIGLPQWTDRFQLTSYQTALAFKRKRVPVFNATCNSNAHNKFRYFPVYRNTQTELIKKDFGHHCSLYDVFSLYLHYVLD